ncbi:MAG: amidohydrolase family protein, partial [Armatimonadota bacterium]
MELSDRVANATGPVRYRARWVLPVSGPPIPNGEVVVENGRIVACGLSRSREADIDFGNAAILPGFVNAHAHLDYTVMRSLLPNKPFFEWIRELVSLKAHFQQRDWLESAQLGAVEMAGAGITTVADASDSGAGIGAMLSSGLRGIVFREVFGIESAPESESIIGRLASKVADMRRMVAAAEATDRIGLGISPHAVYTVRPDLLRDLAEFARGKSLVQMIHADESAEEEALLRHGTGPFAAMFAARGIRWRTPGGSAISHIAASGGFEAPTIAVHCVHIDADDPLRMVRSGVSVVHCPRSNANLGAGSAPLRMMLDAGLDVGLGTDSVLSSGRTDFFEEMRSMVHQTRLREGDARLIPAREAIRIATLGGARALGMEADIGTLEVGKWADFCVVRFDAIGMWPAGEDAPEETLVHGAT